MEDEVFLVRVLTLPLRKGIDLTYREEKGVYIMQYTAGELAKLLGVSSRTIRFYDEKNILTPCGYSDSGYRLYDEQSVQRLQKIIMLKFMNFSLEQIAGIMQNEGFDIRESLREQELMLIEKKEHILRIIDAVRKTENSSDEELWDNMLHVIEITKEREEVVAQYATDENLINRISIHDFSTSKQGFYSWLLESIDLKANMKILDIGCGNAFFWKSIAKELPDNLEIHLVDYSDGMMESAKKNVEDILKEHPKKGLKFVVDKRDATDFSYPISGFDRIMANHVLFHLSKDSRLQLYPKIQALLAKGGRFSCSLIGKNHMKELHDFIDEYYPNIGFPSEKFDFLLETAEEELKNYFKVIKVEEQENDLLVPDEELVFNYVGSYSQTAKEIISKEKKLFLEHVCSKKNTDGYMYIHKSTGNVVCEALC